MRVMMLDDAERLHKALGVLTAYEGRLSAEANGFLSAAKRNLERAINAADFKMPGIRGHEDYINWLKEMEADREPEEVKNQDAASESSAFVIASRSQLRQMSGALTINCIQVETAWKRSTDGETVRQLTGVAEDMKKTQDMLRYLADAKEK